MTPQTVHYDFQNGAGVRVGVIALKRLLSPARGPRPPSPGSLAAGAAPASAEPPLPPEHSTFTPSWRQNSWRAPLLLSGKLVIWRLNAGDLRSLSWGRDWV